MNPKEKANDLFNNAIGFTDGKNTSEWKANAVKVCNFVVDEILKSDPLSPSKFDNKVDKVTAYKKCESESYEYWQEVKEELEKL